MIAVANDKGDHDVGFAFSDVFAASETGCLSTIRTTSTSEATVEEATTVSTTVLAMQGMD
eukprot:11207307-Lingulodinium_polyedra.AAC.1